MTAPLLYATVLKNSSLADLKDFRTRVLHADRKHARRNRQGWRGDRCDS